MSGPYPQIPMLHPASLLLLLSFAVLTGCSAQQAGQSAALRPNIVFIMADDLGYGDLGCYGQTEIRTPVLDRLAAEGMHFSDCYTGSPVCAPSRSVLMTGKHTGHTTVRDNFAVVGREDVPGGRVPLAQQDTTVAQQDTTVAELLRRAGYATGMMGKWGLGEPGSSGEPNSQGFDEWFGFLNQRHAHTHFPDYLWHNRDTFHIPENREKARKIHSQDLFTRFALAFIDEQAAKQARQPFFLYLPYTLPHDERASTPEFTALYADKDWDEGTKNYAAMVSQLDAHVGKVLARLEAHGLAENTIVFFCSDNGAANRYEGVLNSSGVLRGRKRDMYEGGIRTPMIVRWPGNIAAGSQNDLPWYFADVLPTLATLAGVALPAGLDGISVVPALLGEDVPDAQERALYWEFHEKGFFQAIRWKNWKGVRTGLTGPLELYDLTSDVGETTNIAAAQPDVVRQLEQLLATARTDSPYWPVE